MTVSTGITVTNTVYLKVARRDPQARKSPWTGNGYLLKYSCLRYSSILQARILQGQEGWRATVHGGHRVRHHWATDTTLRLGGWGFPDGSVVKNPPDNAGEAEDMGSIPGSGKSSGEGNGNSLQYSYLENPTDRVARGLQRAGHNWTTQHAQESRS